MSLCNVLVCSGAEGALITSYGYSSKYVSTSVYNSTLDGYVSWDHSLEGPDVFQFETSLSYELTIFGASDTRSHKFVGWYTYPENTTTPLSNMVSSATNLVSTDSTITQYKVESECSKCYGFSINDSYILVAKYRWKQHVTISYDGMGGTPEKSIDYIYEDESYILLPGASREGYNFAGWYSDRECRTFVGNAGSQYTTDSNTTLYAKWNIKIYTVSFDANGGSGAPPKMTVRHLGSLTIPMTMPTKADSTFKYWVKRPSDIFVAGRSYPYSFFTSNPTLFAYYTGNNVLITLDANGGSLPSGTSPFIIKEVEQEIGQLPTPIYLSRFIGWYTEKIGGTLVTQSTAVSSSMSIIYAHWDENQEYSVTFIDPTSLNQSSSMTCYRGTAFTIPVIGSSGLQWSIPEGMSQSSEETWTTDVPNGTKYSGGQSAMNLAEAGDNINLYANWVRNNMTVTFLPWGGISDEYMRLVPYGGQLGKLPFASYEGKKLVGWFTALFGGEEVFPSKVITSNITLHARWTNADPNPVYYIKYKIILETNGGTISQSYGELKYVYGHDKDLPTGQQISKSGNTFDGWYSNPSFSGSPITVITAGTKGKQTFYAKWV